MTGTRRTTIALLFATAAARAGQPPTTATAQDSSLAAVAARARSGAHGLVDRMLVMRDGKVILNERFEHDYRALTRGMVSPMGCGWECTDSSLMNQFNYLHPNWHPLLPGTQLHTLQSVTKSVTATLFGIALQRGELKTLDQPLLAFFSRYDLTRVDLRLRKATLKDLLTMRTGIEWHETDRPYDSTNTTVQLERSRDWMQFTLSQPMDAEPGTRFTYNSGGSALMAEVLRQATGVHVDEYARRHLFGPLGITRLSWKKIPTGHPDTEGGLYLEPEDLAKIGQLHIDDGLWNGKRILPAGWSKEATGRHVDHINPANASSPGYGYQWWRYDRRGTEIWAGNGFGGQFLIIIPQHRIVGVLNSWNIPGLVPAGSTPLLNPFISALLDLAGVPPG